jgi:hypothetical protein
VQAAFWLGLERTEAAETTLDLDMVGCVHMRSFPQGLHWTVGSPVGEGLNSKRLQNTGGPL